jgi:tripartite ATP-independent transporter DctM subunit
MFRGFAPWLNWLPGRLMYVNVLACGVFGSVSGSSAATCATVAKIALPELKKRGYDENLSLGSLAGAGTLGILIPPSITMVVYAVQANVSIIQVFLAGFLPGLLVMALYSGYISAWSLANPKRTPLAVTYYCLPDNTTPSAAGYYHHEALSLHLRYRPLVARAYA